KGGYKISIPEYAIEGREEEVLNHLKDTLKLYPGYLFEIQSHSKQPGDDRTNLQKTEKRAEDFFFKLYGKKEKFDRFDFRGYGEVEPLFLSEKSFYQEKNERIDIHFSLPAN
ncbi:MAG: hypothetical protein KDK45_06625, partial [Leptospiraceae bacterium]|nr:hypothetical protein [Leptospiraceae bacterium]